MAGGAVLVLVGATMPWFTAGPASRLGVADDGWPCLIAGVAIAAGAFGARITGRQRWLGVIISGSVIVVVTAVFALLTPPESMTMSAGPYVCLLGAVLAAAGAVRSWNGIAAPLTAGPAAADGAPRSPVRTARRVAGGVALVLVGALVVLACWPIRIGGLRADPDPTADFTEAVARFDEVTAAEPDFVYAPCRSRLYDHGERTDVAVVLFHGLTNCPRQYQEMAESIFAQGANVLVLRAPGHGHATSDGGEIAGAGALHSLNARQLADYGDDAVDIAVGLGDDVRVHGLSMGGMLALWTAQNRSDVDRVVAMAPAFALPKVPNAVSNAFTNLFARTPSITRSHQRNIDHDYAAFSTRGLAASFALGQAVMDDGLEFGPVVGDVTVVLNPDDPLVHEPDIEDLVASWDRSRDAVDVILLDSVGLPHDGIDLAQPEADPDVVYPVILEALGFDWNA